MVSKETEDVVKVMKRNIVSCVYYSNKNTKEWII